MQHTPQGQGGGVSWLQQETTPAGGQPFWEREAQQVIADRQAGRSLQKKADGSYQVVQGPAQVLSLEDKAAILEAHRQQYGFGFAGPQASDTPADIAAKTAAGNSTYQNVAGAASSDLLRIPAALFSLANPTGENARDFMRAAEAPVYDPESKAAQVTHFAGTVGRTIPGVISPALAGPIAGEMAMEQAGTVRQDVAQRRAQGQQISGLQELTDAAAQAASMYAVQRFGFANAAKPGGALGLQALNATEKQSLLAVAHAAAAKYATNAGIQGGDMMAMQAANNVVDRLTGVNPNKGAGEGVADAGVTGLATGVLTSGLHGIGHGVSPEAGQPRRTEVPVPSAETLESLKTGPKEAAAPNESKEAATPAPSPESEPAEALIGRPLLDAAKPKFRSYGTDGRGLGVPLEFASAEDKALYLATQPTRGKISIEAGKYLTEHGYRPEDINRYGDELRGRIAELAKNPPAEGHSLFVQNATPADDATNSTTQEVPTKPASQLPEGRLPTPPLEILRQSNNVIREWAEDNGYDVSRIAKEKGQGKYAIKTELLRQMEAGVPRPGPATLPPEAQSWDAGKLRQWATANGIDIPDVITRESVSRPDEPARKSLFRFLTDATGMGQGRQSADSLPHVEPSAGAHRGANPAPSEPEKTSAPGSEPQMLPGGKPDERLARTDDDEVLSRVMKGAYRVTSGLGAHEEFLNIHKELTGQDAIPYAGGRGRGFRAEGRTFYNVEQNQTPQLRREAIAHEATHHLQDTRPDLVNQLDRAIPEGTRADLLKEYQKSYQRQEGKALSTDMHAKEIQAMAVGRIFSRPSVARQVMQENPGLFTRAADAVITKLRGLTSGGQLTNQVVAFLQTARAESTKLAAGRGESATRRVREPDAKDFLPEPSQRLRDEAEEYTRKAGIPYHPDTEYASVDEGRARQIADLYAASRHEPNLPEVRKSYDAMKRETLAQFNFLRDKGVKFEPWKGEGQPYKDSAEMTKDVRDNRHLYFFQGADLPEDHPLAERAPGTPYTYNDVFRAVHDYFGHTKEGVGFGPRGEENAWRSHSQMYSEEARPAMTNETRGQNSWVNYGPHGEHNRANPADTIYAEQKAATLPPEFTRVDQANGVQFLPTDPKEREEALANLHTVGLREKANPTDKGLFAQEIHEAPAYSSIEDVAKKLNDRSQALAGVAKARESEKLARAQAAGIPEAEYQLQQPDSGKDWYKQDIAKMEKTMQSIHPELKQPEKMTLFKALLAITSQGNNPNVNLKHAEGIYDLWQKTGEMPVKQPSGINWPGTLGENYKLPLGRLDAMTKEMGEKGAAKWLLAKHTVDEVNQWSEAHGYNANVSGPKDAEVRGMEIFGPKVGVFASNLHGIQDKITKDMWFSRTWNRWMGTMLDSDGIVDAPRNDAERQTMEKAVENLSQELGMEPSALQATLWYYEQQLWKAHGAKVDSGSFSKAAERIANGDRYDAGRTSATTKGRPTSEGGEASLFGGATRGDGESGGEGGGPAFLPGGAAAGKFRDEDIKPRLAAAADAVGKAWEGTKNLLGLQNTGEAKQAKGILRERGSELAQRMDRLTDAFGPSKAAMDSMPQADTRAFIDNMEKGQAQADPKLQPIADALRGLLDDRLKQVQSRGKLTNFIQDYFPHLWEDPTGKAKAFAAAAARRPMEGGKSFLRQRSLPLFSDGIAAGLEPVTENPVEASMLRVREMDKFITAHDALTEMKAKGLLKKVPARGALPEGYAKINDSVGTIYAPPNRKGGISIAGFFAAPEAVASVVNNNLSPGLRNDPHFGGLFRGYLGAGNILNQSSLGLSVFHGTTSALNAAVSEFGLGIKDAVEGRPGQGIKRMGFGLSLVGPAARDYWNGSQVLKEWNRPGSTTPDIAAMVDAMKAGGGRAGMDDFYHTGATDKMMEAFRKGNVIGGAMRMPLAALEQTSKPVLEYLVPRLKMGAFMQAAKGEMDNNPGMGREEMRKRMGEVWNSVDNRFGEMVHDNVFWNRTVKDLAMASFRSVGWNMGTFRELGGGLKDFATMGKRMMLDRSLANTEMTHRMAYTTALPVLTGLVGAVVHKMLSGDDPKELKDLYFPKTGEKDHDGHDVRLALPSYMKDVYGFAHSPFHTLANKAHPMLNTILEMLANKDYYGTKIRNEDDPAMKQGLSLLEHLGSAAAPISLKDTAKLVQEGQGSKAILPALGITHAPGYITKSPAELKAQELMEERMPRGTRTQEQADRSAKVRSLADALRANEAGVRNRIQQAIGDESLTPEDVQAIRDRQKFTTPIAHAISRLGVHEAMQVWKLASDEEKRSIGPAMLAKVRASKVLTRDERVKFMRALQDDQATLRGGVTTAAGEEN